MADESLLTMTQITEAQIKAMSRLYAVIDPAGTAQDVYVPLGSFLGGFYKIAPSVASGNLTLALQHLDGTDPSATDPLGFKIGNDWQLVVSSLSVTKNAATNWCNLGSTELAAKTHDLFVYLIQETGASAGTKLGYSRIPCAKTMADFVNTTTSEKYIAGSHTNFNATDEVALIGRFAAQLSATASFAWSIPTALVLNYPIHKSEWRTYQPVGLTSASMTFSVTSTDKAEYMIDWTELAYEVKVAGTTGGTGNDALNISSPFNATNASHLIPRPAYYTDGGDVLTGHCNIGTSLLSFQKVDNSNFGLGANRFVSSAGRYRIG